MRHCSGTRWQELTRQRRAEQENRHHHLTDVQVVDADADGQNGDGEEQRNDAQIEFAERSAQDHTRNRCRNTLARTVHDLLQFVGHDQSL